MRTRPFWRPLRRALLSDGVGVLTLLRDVVEAATLLRLPVEDVVVHGVRDVLVRRLAVFTVEIRHTLLLAAHVLVGDAKAAGEGVCEVRCVDGLVSLSISGA